MANQFEYLAREGVRQLTPYQPGKPVEELERELGISNSLKLASNENPLGCSQKVVEYLASGINDLAVYPDANGFYLKTALAQLTGLDVRNITLGNGSNDVLDMLARVFAGPGDEIIYSEYAFLVYPIATKAVGATGICTPSVELGHDLVAMAAAVSENTKLIFIANPNNPTGTCCNESELRMLLDTVPERVVVVVDEAYVEYATMQGYPDTIKLMADYPNLVITRTFSKAYGLAGLRVGFCLSHPDIADLLNRVRQPFNNSGIALKAAEIALQDKDFIRQTVECNRHGYAELTAALEQNAIEFVPSQGNFILAKLGSRAQEIYQEWLGQGIIVRPVANYGLTDYLRITIGSSAQNQRLIRLLEDIRAH